MVNAFQQTTPQITSQITSYTTSYTITVTIPMVAISILILLILITCLYLFKKNPENSEDPEIRDERKPLLEDGNLINSEPIVEYSGSSSIIGNINEGISDIRKQPAFQPSESSCMSSEVNQKEKSLISFDDTIKPNELNLVGLQNENNECYMNCIFQSLASSEYLIKQLKSIYKELHASSLLENTIELIDNLNNTEGKTSAENNTKLLKTITDLIKWTKTSQQDVYEFLSEIIKNIHDEMKEKEKLQLEPPLKIKMLHTFCGLNIQDKTQYHIGLSVGLCGNYQSKPGVTIEFLIDQYFSSSKIDEDETKTTQVYFYQQIPQVLLIHIQANKWISQKGILGKPIYFIQYKEDLCMDFPVHENENVEKKNTEYKLVAVIHHMGDMYNGHYVTYRKFKNNWLLANDTQVEQKPFDKNVCPYVLIYEKISK